MSNTAFDSLSNILSYTSDAKVFPNETTLVMTSIGKPVELIHTPNTRESFGVVLCELSSVFKQTTFSIIVKYSGLFMKLPRHTVSLQKVENYLRS